MRLQELLEGVEVQEISADPDTEISGISIDSRECRPGDLFFARKGFSVDGTRFIPQAVTRGAIAVVCEEQHPEAENIVVRDVREALAICSRNFYGKADEQLLLVGITGTNGKTTTAYFVQHALQNAGGCGMIGTVSTFDGVSRIPAVLTTPESHEINRLLKQMGKNECRFAVLEVSAHALTLKRVAGLAFDVAVFTNLSQDHLDFYKTMDAYLEAKKSLFRNLPATGVAVVNCDDDACPAILDACSCTVVTYSPAGQMADIRVLHVETVSEGSIVTLEVFGRQGDIQIPLYGNHNAANLAAAAGVFSALQLDTFTVLGTLKSMTPVPGRMERIPSVDDIHYFVDFAHTPDGLEQALRSVKPLVRRRLICVFGCGGDRDRTKRPLMLSAVCRYADYVVATADNPRSESQEQIFDDMKPGQSADVAVDYISDRRSAILQAVQTAEPGDVVVVAGKGHESYQIIGNHKKHFSDGEEILRAFKEREK